MKIKVLVSTLLSCLALLTQPAFGWTDSFGIGSSAIRMAGPEVPFPLSAELPFPWGTIEGSWQADGNGIKAVFSFEVQTDFQGRKILRVIHVDPVTGKMLAVGTGIGIDDQRIVRAAMRGNASSENYMLFIGAYKNPKGGTLNVLTMRSFNQSINTDKQVIVRKISELPLYITEFGD